jgi:diaminobutyrate-2-oxoglutarate transaminase
LDQWKPGEHNGTFRGNNLAFVTATAALEAYWGDDAFAKSVQEKGRYIAARLDEIAAKFGDGNFSVSGRGMFQGLNCVNGEIASQITKEAFKKGLIIETSGADSQVVKILCPLVISEENLQKGLNIVERAVAFVCAQDNEIPDNVCYFDDIQKAS